MVMAVNLHQVVQYLGTVPILLRSSRPILPGHVKDVMQATLTELTLTKYCRVFITVFDEIQSPNCIKTYRIPLALDRPEQTVCRLCNVLTWSICKFVLNRAIKEEEIRKSIRKDPYPIQVKILTKHFIFVYDILKLVQE